MTVLGGATRIKRTGQTLLKDVEKVREPIGTCIASCLQKAITSLSRESNVIEKVPEFFNVTYGAVADRTKKLLEEGIRSGVINDLTADTGFEVFTGTPPVSDESCLRDALFQIRVARNGTNSGGGKYSRIKKTALRTGE